MLIFVSLYIFVTDLCFCLSLMMDSAEIELVIDDWSTFLQSHYIFKNNRSASIDGFKWNLRVWHSEPRDPVVREPREVTLGLQIGFIELEPDPSSPSVCAVAILLSANPSTIFSNEYTIKQEVMICGEFSYCWNVPILQDDVVDDIVVLKVRISQINKFCLKQPPSYTLQGLPAGRTNVDGIIENIQYPTLFVPNIDDEFKNPIELWSFNPFMARSLKHEEFYVPPESKPEGVENVENYLQKHDSKLGPDCNELVILHSLYPQNDGGLAWMNFIRIRRDLKGDSITNRWLKLSQPPRPQHDGLEFTTLGWVIWKCDKMDQSCYFRFRMWIFGDNEVKRVHDEVIVLRLESLPIFLFTFDKIYSLGVGDIATCALKGDQNWITYLMKPFVGQRRKRSKFLQWREDSFLLVDYRDEGRRFIYEIKFVSENGEKWYNVIPRFAITVPYEWKKWPILITPSFLVFSGPNDTVTIFFLQPLSLASSALLVVEKQLARYKGVNWNGDQISVGQLTEELLYMLKWKYMKKEN